MSRLTALIEFYPNGTPRNTQLLHAAEALDQAGFQILSLSEPLEFKVRIDTDDVSSEEQAEDSILALLCDLDIDKVTVLLSESEILDPDDVCDGRTAGLNYGLSCAGVA